MTLLVSPLDLPTYIDQRVKEPQAQLLLDLASDVVRAYCGWRIDRGTETLVVESAPARRLFLPTLQLNAVQTVTVDADPVTGYRWTVSGTLDSAGYAWEGSRVEATVDHGYDQVPGEIRAVVLALAGRVVVNPQQLRSVTLGDGYAEAYAMAGAQEVPHLGLNAHERRILDKHRVYP